MKAARVLQFGPPNVIMTDDLPRPEPGAGQLLVRVKAAGVGNWDALVREGKMTNEHLPLILGYELSGIVEATGAGVSGFKAGDEVYGATNEQLTGAYAEYALPVGQNDGTKTEDLELHRGRLCASCDRNSLADAFRLCPRDRRAGNFDPWRRGQRGRVRRATSQAGWPPCGRDRRASDADYVRGLGAETVVDYQRERFEEYATGVAVVLDTVEAIRSNGPFKS